MSIQQSEQSEELQKALLVTAVGQLTLTSIPIPAPTPGTVLGRTAAAALNPVDYGLAMTAYAAVIGLDFAGVVAAVGAGVTALQEGGRVVAQGNWDESRRSGFQEHAIASAVYAARVPAGVALDAAGSLPLGLMTAATGLYQKGDLGAGLRAPWEEGGRGHITLDPRAFADPC